jgi:hypothetical protein
MESLEHLTIMAELAVAFAGFAGIVVVLKREDDDVWTALENARLWGLLVVSLPVAIFALIPIAVNSAGYTEPAVWRISATICVIALGLIGLTTFPRFGAALKSIPEALKPPSTKLLYAVNTSLYVVGLSLYAGIALDIITLKFTAYFSALLAQLCSSATLFLRTLTSRPERRSIMTNEETQPDPRGRVDVE